LDADHPANGVPIPRRSTVKMTGIAFGWIGATTAFGSHVRKANRWCSPSTGSALVPRVPVQGRQSPAKANRGRSSPRANQCGRAGLPGAYSQNAVARDEAAVFWLQPSPPVARAGVADVGDGPVTGHAGRAREAPAQHGQLAAVRAMAHHRGHLVGKDPGQRRHVAGAVHHGPERVANGSLALCDTVEIAHTARCRSRPARSRCRPNPGAPREA
jgi:hypothetical protein